MAWILDKFKSQNFHVIYGENAGTSVGFRVILDRAAVKKTWKNLCHILGVAVALKI